MATVTFRRIGFAALLLSIVIGPAGAAPGADAGEPDQGHGKQIATKGIGEHVPACSQCHGEAGIGDGSGAFPRLTGQLPFYLYQQLRGFAAGARANPVMSPIAKGLSDQDMQDVAAYYAAQQGPYFPQPFVDQAVLERGGRLSAVGQSEAGVPACVSCHGQAGKGSGELFPYLAGQYQSYLAKQLRDFKSGLRHNDPMAVMRDIAAKLPDGDVDAVGAYFASVRPPCQCNETTTSSAKTPAGSDMSGSSGKAGSGSSKP